MSAIEEYKNLSEEIARTRKKQKELGSTILPYLEE
jgi:hypothetical protein